MRRVPPPVLAGASGVLFGVGASVLLQQFAVWPLTVLTLVVLPLALGIACGAGTRVLQRRAGGTQ